MRLPAMKPEVRSARNGDVAIAFAVVGDGPFDLVYLAPFGNLEVVWENRLFGGDGFLRRLRGTGARSAVHLGHLGLHEPTRDRGALGSAYGRGRIGR